VDEVFAECAFAASLACYVAAALGCVYALVAAYAARRFVAAASSTQTTGSPAVTILKPLHGAEPNLYANLARFCVQDYPAPVQIVFGVSDPADPSVEVVRKIVAAFPDSDLTLAISSRRHGSNRKISNLVNMASEARHDVLVISDSDIVVDPVYLKNIAASLQQPGVGLVTCLYRGVAAEGAWARLAKRAGRPYVRTCRALLWLDHRHPQRDARHDRRFSIGRRSVGGRLRARRRRPARWTERRHPGPYRWP